MSFRTPAIDYNLSEVINLGLTLPFPLINFLNLIFDCSNPILNLPFTSCKADNEKINYIMVYNSFYLFNLKYSNFNFYSQTK